MPRARLGAAANGLRGPVGDKTENQRKSQLSTGFYPADHLNCGLCNNSHQSHLLAEEVRVIGFRKMSPESDLFTHLEG